MLQAPGIAAAHVHFRTADGTWPPPVADWFRLSALLSLSNTHDEHA